MDKIKITPASKRLKNEDVGDVYRRDEAAFYAPQWSTPEMAEKFHDETRKMAANYVWGSHPDRITTGHEGEE